MVVSAYKLVFIFIIINVKLSKPAKILAIIPTPFYSHQIIFQPIWKALSLRHEVTVLTTQPCNDPRPSNLTEIDINFLSENGVVIAEFLRGDQNIFKTLFVFIEYFMKISDDLMELNIIKSIINGSEYFDLVMYEQTFPIFSALCLKMKSACIALTPFEMDENLNPHMALPSHSAIHMNFVFPMYKDFNFLERIFSEVFKLFGGPFAVWSFGHQFDKRIKKYFGSNYSLEIAEKNVDMVFVNTDPAFSIKKPKLANVIEFDGTGMKEKRPLPIDLQTFLDSNTNGTILMSLGSTIKTKYLDPKLINMFLEAFSELPYNILWKSEIDFLNKSDNVKIIEWGPQHDILNHENVVLFINHAGLQSVTEALHSHTPLLVLPYCGDNARWAKMVEQLGIGIKVDKFKIDKALFKATIIEVITDKKYKLQMMKLAEISEDQQVNDLDKIVWWTDYVIRHKGAKHLRSPLLDLPWYKYYCVDVYLTLLFIIYLLYRIISYTCHTITRLYLLCKFLKRKIKTE